MADYNTKLNLDNDNVWQTEMTVAQAREACDLDLPDDVVGAFDNAQGHVFTDAGKEAFIVIKITK